MAKNFSFFLRIVVLIVIMLGFANVSEGQEKGYPLDLDKLILYKVYQKDSVIAKLGQPDSYSNYVTEFGLSEEYIFGEEIRQILEKNKSVKSVPFLIINIFILYGKKKI
jgi:hypothetical protein